MYYDKFLPFYLTYASPALYSGERMQEREFALMKSYFPDTALKVQEKVEEECELLDYEGSRIREQVAGELELQEISDRFLDDLIEVLLYQEISRKRCRRRRCRGF